MGKKSELHPLIFRNQLYWHQLYWLTKQSKRSSLGKPIIYYGSIRNIHVMLCTKFTIRLYGLENQTIPLEVFG